LIRISIRPDYRALISMRPGQRGVDLQTRCYAWWKGGPPPAGLTTSRQRANIRRPGPRHALAEAARDLTAPQIPDSPAGFLNGSEG
jgi:hypothetical protein